MSAPRIILASLPSFCQKIIKIGGNLTKFWPKQFCRVSFETRCRYYTPNAKAPTAFVKGGSISVCNVFEGMHIKQAF